MTMRKKRRVHNKRFNMATCRFESWMNSIGWPWKKLGNCYLIDTETRGWEFVGEVVVKEVQRDGVWSLQGHETDIRLSPYID